MVKVVVVNGTADSGKYDFLRMCREKLRANRQMCVCLSYTSFARHIAAKAGLDQCKTQEDYEFVETIHRALIKWNNTPLKDLITDIDAYHYTGVDYIICVDANDLTDIFTIKAAFNASTMIICSSQAKLGSYDRPYDPDSSAIVWDYPIWLDGSEGCLEKAVDAFIASIMRDDAKIYK